MFTSQEEYVGFRGVTHQGLCYFCSGIVLNPLQLLLALCLIILQMDIAQRYSFVHTFPFPTLPQFCKYFLHLRSHLVTHFRIRSLLMVDLWIAYI